jgi:tripartite-type tricarboxylate transporter receptor subunit TctC
MMAEHMRVHLGYAVVVENQTGAGGRLALRTVKDAAPDGNTILFASGAQMFLQPHLSMRKEYDPFTDFVPIMHTLIIDQVVAVGGESPAKSIDELVRHVKASPDAGSFGSPGIGTQGHFTGAEFARLSGLELRHVPYRGTPAALPDLRTGRIGMMFAAVGELIEQHRAGAVRILAMASEQRSRIFPDFPTFRESNLDIRAPGYFAFYAPAGTPPENVQRLQQAVTLALNAQDVTSRLAALGVSKSGLTDFRGLEQAEYQRWGAIVRASGFKPES